MKQIIFLTIFIFSIAFVACNDDDNFAFNNDITGEWTAINPEVTSDSVKLTGYIFNTDGTGRIIYDDCTREDIKQFMLKISDMEFKSKTEFSITSETFRVKYKETNDGNGKKKKSLPDSVIVDLNSYRSYMKYIKYLDEDSLVFTDRYGNTESIYKKLR